MPYLQNNSHSISHFIKYHLDQLSSNLDFTKLWYFHQIFIVWFIWRVGNPETASKQYRTFPKQNLCNELNPKALLYTIVTITIDKVVTDLKHCTIGPDFAQILLKPSEAFWGRWKTAYRYRKISLLSKIWYLWTKNMKGVTAKVEILHRGQSDPTLEKTSK